MNKGFIVCAMADTKLTLPGSTFDLVCSKCSARVMIAPSGKKFLKDNPGVKVLCAKCFEDTAPPDAKIQIVDSPESLIEELQRAQPNQWRNRN